MADGSEEPIGKTKSRSKRRNRPYYRNPYLNFLREFRELPEHQHVSSKMIFVLAGQKWRSLSESEREPYISQAQAARAEPRNFKIKRRSGRRATLRNRMCSKCGHRHGSPNMDDDSDGNTTRDDQSASASIRSRSRSPSGSKSDNKSGSATTCDDFSEDTGTTF